jgi:hypothetical protein
LFRRTPLPGKPSGKMALSSSNDRSQKNREFPYAENYALGVNIRNELPELWRAISFLFFE